MTEEEKSQASVRSGASGASGANFGGAMQGDTFSKVDEILFSFLFPLYEQKKKPNELWNIFMIVWQIVQMSAMSLYSVDIQTNQVSRVASVVGYLDGSQLSLIIGKYLPYVNIGIFVLEIAMIG
ncbi:MAG: hypothetical protein EZS28_037542, partial [Streblomastix strix]